MDNQSVTFGPWTCKPEVITRDCELLYIPHRAGIPLTYGEAMQLLRDDQHFRQFLISLLAAAPFRAYRWETPPVTTQTNSRRFEFVLINDPMLERTADAEAFSSHFKAATPGKTTTAFPSLGKDAILIVPCPQSVSSFDSHQPYVHLGAFVRHAPAAQVQELWQTVGAMMPNHIRDTPLWLSTAGMGVSWLHVRIDQKPKYYKYQAYYKLAQDSRAPEKLYSKR